MSKRKKTSASSTKPSKKATGSRQPAAKKPARALKTTAAVGSQAKKTVGPVEALVGDAEVKRIQTLLFAKTPAKVVAGLDRLRALRGTRTDYEAIFNESATRALVCDSELSEKLVSRWEMLVTSLRRFPTVITQIKQVAADAVAKLGGKAELPGLPKVSDNSADILSEFGGHSLELGLKRLSVGVAKALARYKGVLWLNNIKTISADAAKALATSKGELFFGGLTELSADAAEELSNYRGETLSLYGLTKISEEAATALGTHVGRLDLHGLERLSVKAAQALARHHGLLDLGGLTDLADRAASVLNANRDIHLPPDFRFERAHATHAIQYSFQDPDYLDVLVAQSQQPDEDDYDFIPGVADLRLAGIRTVYVHYQGYGDDAAWVYRLSGDCQDDDRCISAATREWIESLLSERFLPFCIGSGSVLFMKLDLTPSSATVYWGLGSKHERLAELIAVLESHGVKQVTGTVNDEKFNDCCVTPADALCEEEASVLINHLLYMVIDIAAEENRRDAEIKTWQGHICVDVKGRRIKVSRPGPTKSSELRVPKLKSETLRLSE